MRRAPPRFHGRRGLRERHELYLWFFSSTSSRSPPRQPANLQRFRALDRLHLRVARQQRQAPFDRELDGESVSEGDGVAGLEPGGLADAPARRLDGIDRQAAAQRVVPEAAGGLGALTAGEAVEDLAQVDQRDRAADAVFLLALDEMPFDDLGARLVVQPAEEREGVKADGQPPPPRGARGGGPPARPSR